MDLSIIIVSWNVREKLKNNLKAIYESQNDFNFEVFVVDNNSQDGTVAMVKKEFPQVNLIANDKNLGFAVANNQAIKKSQGEFILLLNPDMKVFPDTLKNMLDWMRANPQATVAGCHLVDEQGNTIKQVRHFPQLFDQLMIVLKIPHLFPGVLNKYLCHDFDYSKPSRVDSIRGSFFMIRRVASLTPNPSPVLGSRERGILLDEQFFIWFEEVDYCKQIYASGKEVWYTSATKCVDYVGQSFSLVPIGTKQKYFRDSMLKYFKKWQPRWQYYILKLAWIISGGLTLIYKK
jgi:hypothetical protein